MNNFSNQFRIGGSRAGETPTNGEYIAAVRTAYQNAGLPANQAQSYATQAQSQLSTFGYSMNSLMPSLPPAISVARSPTYVSPR